MFVQSSNEDLYDRHRFWKWKVVFNLITFELNINTATEEEIHKFEKNTSIHYIGAVEKTIQFEIFTDSKLEVDLE